MNTHSNAIPESFQAQDVASGGLFATRLMKWSVRRELWENRSIYTAHLSALRRPLFKFIIRTSAPPWDRLSSRAAPECTSPAGPLR